MDAKGAAAGQLDEAGTPLLSPVLLSAASVTLWRKTSLSVLATLQLVAGHSRRQPVTRTHRCSGDTLLLGEDQLIHRAQGGRAGTSCSSLLRDTCASVRRRLSLKPSQTTFFFFFLHRAAPSDASLALSLLIQGQLDHYPIPVHSIYEQSQTLDRGIRKVPGGCEP